MRNSLDFTKKKTFSAYYLLAISFLVFGASGVSNNTNSASSKTSPSQNSANGNKATGNVTQTSQPSSNITSTASSSVLNSNSTSTSVYFYSESNLFSFIVSNFSPKPNIPTPYGISLPPISNTGSISSNYSILNANFLTMDLPMNSTLITVQFDRSCILPILSVAFGTKISVTFVTQIPQQFIISASQCGVPDIQNYDINTMGYIPTFGYNTFNSVQSGFFTQTINLASSTTVPSASVYCPYFAPGSNSFIFSVTVNYAAVSPTSVNIYDLTGNIIANPYQLTVPPTKTVSIYILTTETSLNFQQNNNILAWADGQSQASASGEVISNRRLSVSTIFPSIRKLALTASRTNSTTSNGITTLLFPPGVNSYAHFYNSDPTNSKTITVTFNSVPKTGFWTTTMIAIFAACGGAFLIGVIISIVCVKHCKKKKNEIVYMRQNSEQGNQVPLGSPEESENATLVNSGFKVEQIPNFNYPREPSNVARNSNLNLIREPSLGRNKSSIKPQTDQPENNQGFEYPTLSEFPPIENPEPQVNLYSVETRRQLPNKKENNVLEVYTERYR